MQTKTQEQWCKGFTMIELLVVVAIIMVLAGMLLPGMMNARESGRRTVCMNNIKQQGLAVNYCIKDLSYNLCKQL